MSLPERFQTVTTSHQNRTTPQLSIYANGGGHFNAPAIRQLFGEDVEAFLVGTDAAACELAFVGADPDLEESYIFSQDDQGAGGDVTIGRALKDLGIDIDDIEETQHVDLTEEDGVVLADLSGLLDSDDEPDTPTAKADTIELEFEEEDESSAESEDAAAADDDDEPVIDQASIKKATTESVDVDEDLDRDEKVTAYLESQLDHGESLQATAGEIGDAVDEDGRSIPRCLKKLDGYVVEAIERDPPASNIWVIHREEESEDAGDDDVLEDAERPSKDEVRFWCGRCGKGPFQREDQVEGHHQRSGHADAYVARALQPTDDELLNNSKTPSDAGDGPLKERIIDMLDWETPDSRWFKIADFVIPLDEHGNDVQEVLEELTLEDGYRVERAGHLWCIDPVDTGGDA